MRRTANALALVAIISLALPACTAKRSTQTAANTEAAANKQPSGSDPKPETKPATGEYGTLRVGEASGTYTAKGETVALKYAYAGRAQRFGEDSLVILLTDKEIPSEALAEEIKSQAMLLDGKLRGLEYVISKDGYWVRFHPSQYQESKTSSLKDYQVSNDVVTGRDEDNGDLTDGRYQRSVKFVAAISK